MRGRLPQAPDPTTDHAVLVKAPAVLRSTLRFSRCFFSRLRRGRAQVISGIDSSLYEQESAWNTLWSLSRRRHEFEPVSQETSLKEHKTRVDIVQQKLHQKQHHRCFLHLHRDFVETLAKLGQTFHIWLESGVRQTVLYMMVAVCISDSPPTMEKEPEPHPASRTQQVQDDASHCYAMLPNITLKQTKTPRRRQHAIQLITIPWKAM